MAVSATDPLAQYNSRTMLSVLVQRKSPEMFLRKRLVSREETHDTEFIEIDIQKGGQTVAAFVSRQGDPTEISKRSFGTNIHCIPYLYDSLTLTPTDLKTRNMGETVYAGGKGNKLSRKIGEGLEDMSDRFDINEERQIAQALQTGKVTVSGKDVSYEVDYQMDASHLIDVGAGDVWSGTANDILSQLTAAAKLVRETGAPPVTEMYLGETATANFMENAAIIEKLDNRRIEIGNMAPEVLSAQGATFLGRIKWIGVALDVYDYSARYVDEDGASQSYIDPVNAILTSPNVRMDMHYGMIESMQNTEGVKRLPDTDVKKKKALVTLESAPLFGLHQPDGVVRIKTEL